MSSEFYGVLSALGVLLFVVGLPLLLSNVIASSLKAKEDSGRIFWTLLALCAGLAPFAWPWIANTRNAIAHREATTEWEETWEKNLEEAKKEGDDAFAEAQAAKEKAKPIRAEKLTFNDAIRLGIDLAGGTNLVYEVEKGELDRVVQEDRTETKTAVMQRLIGAIGRRVNPSGTEEVTVRQVGLDRIEIIMPGAEQDEVTSMKSQLTRLGSLEFAILATNTFAQHRSLIADARKLPDTQRDVYEGTTLRASWRDVATSRETGEFKDVGLHGDVTRRFVTVAGEETPQYLVVFGDKDDRVTGEHLQRARPERDEAGRSAVAFTFDGVGGNKFFRLTNTYKPRQGTDPYRLAVLLDDKIHSAPNLQAVIKRNGQITGVEGAEVEELVNVLNAGALPVRINTAPISEATIGPTLAADVQSKGKWAIIIAASAVVVFMLLYYAFAGLVADLCLVMNLVLVMGTMVLIRATFTLPGLAGIVLTIGMAVDANVLIFERIREELAKGSRLKMAIQNGFSKAFTTIVDANVTTLLTAVVLYMIGTDQVRGFAVTLFIGIVMSMFTALFVGRLIFDVAEKRRWITDLKMRSIVGQTNWDFLGKRAIAFVVSLVLVVGGMAALTTRGEDNLDIDFSGGIMVTFEFEKGQELDPVRTALENEETGGFGSGVTLERLVTLDEEGAGSGATKRYRLRLKESDVLDEGEDADDTAILDRVRTRITETLEKANLPLRIVTLDEIGDVTAIAAADEDAPADDETAQFAGGNEVTLTFSEPIKTATAENYVVAELAKLNYEQPGSLVSLVGTGGPGLEAAEGEVKLFDEMTLRVTPDVDAGDEAETEDAGDLGKALAAVRTSMAGSPLFEEVNSFSSSVGDEMKWSAVQAMLVSLIAIIGYIWFRFEQVTFGLAAVAALVHDVLVVLGMVAVAAFLSGTPIGSILDLYDFKINLPMIAAFLTIVGYSLNDTIVVFDRIREVRGKNPALTTEMVNTSLNQTLARTLLTSITTFIVVAILYAIGGEGIHGFAFCLVLGVIVGTYSSIYVASPVLLWLMNREAAANAPAVTERSATAS